MLRGSGTTAPSGEAPLTDFQLSFKPASAAFAWSYSSTAPTATSPYYDLFNLTECRC